MLSHGRIDLEMWKDEFLKWDDDAQYRDLVEHIDVPLFKIWRPDVSAYNS